MIVPMKRATVLCLRSDRDDALEQLRELGVVHVVDVQNPSGPDLDALRGELNAATRARDELRLAHAAAARSKGRQEKGAPSPTATGPADATAPPRDGAEAVEAVQLLLKRRRDALDRAEAAGRELNRLSGFGEVDPHEVQVLAAEGIHVRLGLAPAKSLPSAPEGFVLETFTSDHEGVRFAVVSRQKYDLMELDLGAPFTEVRLPEHSTAALRRTIDESGRLGEEYAQQLRAIAASSLEDVCTRIEELSDVHRFATVRAGMGSEQDIRYLNGYVPEEAAARLSELAGERGWGLLLEEPEPGEDVPTMLRYSRAVRPIRGVLDFLNIYPGYWEADIGWTFLIFFSLFFAMLAGDAVYGAFLLICTGVLHYMFRGRVPGHLFGLAYIVSFLTLVWGVVTGSYVGIDIPEFLEALQIPWLADRDHVIELCFIIGAVHLTIAHVWNAATIRPRSKALAQIGWIMVIWSMLFLARTMVLGYSMPGWMPYVLAAGVVLVAVFMATWSELKQNFVNHALLPLTIINSFVDVLSYVRLFAVGFATVAVISAFNMMASQIGFGSVPRAIGAVLVIIFANALNLVLIALAVLVHAVRLNTLEFSTHKGISWQGQPYAPFVRSTTPEQPVGQS